MTAGGADNFGSGAQAGGLNKPFGYNLEGAEPDLDNSMQFRYGAGSRNFQAAKAGRVIGHINPSFDLTDPWIIEAILGAHSAITGTAGSYACTWSEQDVPLSLEIDICEAVTAATFALRKLLGAIVKRATFDVDATSDTPIRMSLECDYSNEVLSAPGSFTVQPAPQQTAPITFANGTIATSSNGVDYTTIANVDRFSVSIDQGAELKHAVGSRTAARKKYGQRKYELSIVNLFDDVSEFLTKLYGGASGPASDPTKINYVKITLTAETSATLTFTFANAYLRTHKQTGNNADDELIESVDLTAQSLSIAMAGWDNTEPTRL